MAKIQLAQPYIKKGQQIESTSGRHGRVDQIGISTTIRKAKAYLAEQYINRAVNQPQGESTSGAAVHEPRSAKRTPSGTVAR